MLTHKFFEGKVPSLNEVDKEMSREQFILLHQHIENIGTAIEKFDFRTALQGMMDISTQGNQLLQNNEPWKKFRTAPELTATVLNLGLQIVTALSIVTQPFMPFLSARLRDLLKLKPVENGDWEKLLADLAETRSIASLQIIPTDQTIGDALHLFTRITDETIDAQIKKLMGIEEIVVTTLEPAAEINQPTDQPTNQPTKPLGETITYEDFIKPDIRTATIIAAERIPKADKLLKLTVDVGFEIRTICSGIAEHFTPEEVTGKQVIIVANLAPRKLRGIESNGMILMAEDDAGKLAFVTPPTGFMNGAVVK